MALPLDKVLFVTSFTPVATFKTVAPGRPGHLGAGQGGCFDRFHAGPDSICGRPENT